MFSEEEKILVNLEEMSEEKEDVEFSEGSSMCWFTLRVLRNEERCIAQIKEHIAMRRLQDKIADVRCLKEFVIVESEEFNPHSEFLPKRGFKSTPTSIWTRLPNGNYKRIRLVERKPFSGMVFIKMEFDPDLFKMIRTWDTGYSFLGFPMPSPMSDLQFSRTAESIDQKVPDLLDYAQQKGYQIVEGMTSKFQTFEKEVDVESEKTEEVQEDFESAPVDVIEDRKMSPEEEAEAKKAQIYSDLNIKDYGSSFAHDASPISQPKSKKLDDQLKVNDFVFIRHLGFKGTIQEIDYAKNRVVVGVQMFGRKQPIECKVEEVSSI